VLSRLCLAFGIALVLCNPLAAEEAPRELSVVFIDTEGGAATLILTPAGESILIDCGNPGKRDAERIHKAAKSLSLKAIDHLIITHWHSDHYGGAEHLSKLIPIRKFYDRGIPEKLTEDPRGFPVLIKAYKKVTKEKSVTLKAGDEIKLNQVAGAPAVKLLCVCASGEVIAEKKGAKPSPFAKEHKPHKADPTDNAKSLGFVLSFGEWRFLDLGDLTWNIEHKLVSPSDRIGPIDVYQGTHHGQTSSNNPVLIKTVSPRVAIHNNGPRKGGAVEVNRTLRALPDLKGLFALHRNLGANDAENADVDKTANDGRKKQSGESIVLVVAKDAKSYTVRAGSKGKAFTYKTRGAK
jgi:competence protein ComEC